MAADINVLRALRDKVLNAFGVGRAFVDWYYEKGPKAANWLNAHPGWKPIVRVGLIIPISLSKLIAASDIFHKIAALLLIFGCIAFASGAGRHEYWSRKKTVLIGSGLAFFAVIVYGIFMTPKPALADRTVTNLDSQEVYFLYEDHIGRPVLMSEYEDIDEDGYFVMETTAGTEEYHLPIWQATYTPFGTVYADFDSTGITVGKEADTQINWTVPFRFPGQYADPELGGRFYYNWNRYYMPEHGRYNRADPIEKDMGMEQLVKAKSGGLHVPLNTYFYSANNPIIFIDPKGLKKCCAGKDGLDCPSGMWSGAMLAGEGIVDITPKKDPGAFYGTVAAGTVQCWGSSNWVAVQQTCLGLGVTAPVDEGINKAWGVGTAGIFCRGKCVEDFSGVGIGFGGGGTSRLGRALGKLPGIFASGSFFDFSGSGWCVSTSLGIGKGASFGVGRICNLKVID